MVDPRDNHRDYPAYSPSHSPREASMSIPIPSHYPTSVGSAERSPRPLPSPSSSRSPSQSSLSAYRSHPYPRRPSLTQAQSVDDRFLPPPNSNSPLHVLHEGRRHRSGSGEDERHGRHERTHSNERERTEWREHREHREHRPNLARAQSDGRFADRGGQYQLPPLSSLTGSSSSSPSTYPLTPTSNGIPPAPGAPMGPPGVPQNTSPDGSRAASPKLFSIGGGGLRPSYSYDNGALGQTPRQSLGLSCYRSENSPPRYDRSQNDREPRHHGGPDRSPPLRSIHNSAPYHDPYAHQGRARSHSAASVLTNRYQPNGAPGPRSSSSDGDWGVQSPPTPVVQPYAAAAAPSGGQSRRLAHLMSEQKRRESINTGFQALRVALPSAIPTDSKAIILRKAVSHITRLEALLHKAGIRANEEDEDVTMSETTGGVRDLTVEMDGKWDDLQVEDVDVERKPPVPV